MITVQPMDMVTVNYQGKTIPAQFIGVYADNDLHECCVGLWEETTGPDGITHRKTKNVRIPCSEILEVNNGTQPGKSHS